MGSSNFAAQACAAILLCSTWAATPAVAQAPPTGQKPNIIVIMGDDIGWCNIGAYNQGIMAGRTPNLDRLAAEGMRFTDYYAEASCTAGRANFITGELPIRTGLTTVGQAGLADRHSGRGADHRHGAEVDGLRHRPVRQEPPRRPQRVPADGARLRRVLRLPLPPRRDGGPGAPQLSAGPEGHGRAAQHDPFLGDRHGRRDRAAALGQDRQAEDRGRRHALSRSGWRPWTTRSSTRRSSSSTRRASDNKPFFVWLNPTRMHVVTHLSEKYEAMRNSENGWSIQEAGMAQLDDIVGSVMKYLKDNGLEDNTIVVFTHRQRRRELHLAGRRPDAVRRRQGHRARRRLPRARRSSAGPARCRPARSRTASCPGSTGSRRSSRRPAIRTSSTSSSRARRSATQTYKVHLDGYNQTAT